MFKVVILYDMRLFSVIDPIKASKASPYIGLDYMKTGQSTIVKKKRLII